ncbi:MAG: SDR family oxidoreductase [Candidatus Thermoplasmatota archaeon]|nr:SDR family oxidoreductase [Candidatus Thermoplasmatota archaeon]
MKLGIEDNSALVLASTSGLGKASAKALAKEGVNVTINGRNEKKLEEAVDELNHVGKGNVKGTVGDISKKEDVRRLVERTVKDQNGLDHLVTCAGGPPSKVFIDTDDQDWYESFDLLVMSVVRSVRESVKFLKEGEGTIVNITSMSVKEAVPNLVLSNSVRMSVIGLMKTLSKELGPEIRANSVLPGPHKTGRIKELIEEELKRGNIGAYEEGLEGWTEDIPMNRLGKPMELGELVAFLSSPRSSFINGAAIPIDGGGSNSNL